MNGHHRAESFQADVVPVKARTSAIKNWKKRNKAERETSMSQGREAGISTVCETEADWELDIVFAWDFPL